MSITNLNKSVIFVIKEMDRYLITKKENMVLMKSLVFTATKSSIYIYKANFTAMKGHVYVCTWQHNRKTRACKRQQGGVQ